MKSWLEKHDIKCIQRIMRENLLLLNDSLEPKKKRKNYKYMASVSEGVYIDKLDDTVNKYNNTYHSTI